MKRLLSHIILSILGIAFANAQQNTPQQIIETIVESNLDKNEEGVDIALIIEDLENLIEHPININSTYADELAKLYILNPIQIKKLLSYIKNNGSAYSIFELKTIDGFTQEILQKMQPFVYFGEVKENEIALKDKLKHARHKLLLRSTAIAQKAKGYKPKENGSIPYGGDRFRYYMRYSFEAGNDINAGFTAEKDPGEAFFYGSNKNGFDYYSAHLSFKLNTTFEKISIGDFIARSGQGLVLWQGYDFGKSADVLSVSKTGQGIRGYTSVDENFYFRGAATTLNLGNGRLSLFYSDKNSDGNIIYTNGKKSYFSSLQRSGYHRTKNEIDDKKAVGNKNIGGIFSWSFNHLKLGITFVQQNFDKPFLPNSQLYNKFLFHGKENYTGGIDYFFSKGNYQLFGEAAVSKSKGKAFVQGAIAHLNDQLSFSTLFRHFNKNYHALWANTFAEGSNTNNETGLYLGVKFLPTKGVSISAYSDRYHSSWLNFTTVAPSNGWDIFIQSHFYLSENTNFYLQFRKETKEYKYKANKRYTNEEKKIEKLRLHFEHKAGNNITLKTRMEYARYQAKENGYLVFQDFQLSPQETPISLSIRLAYFNTQSYNTRIYAYENDILYAFSIPAYYGKGFRSYLNLRYKLSNKLECWLKLANTHWSDLETINSGYNQINGKNKTMLKFQVRLKF